MILIEVVDFDNSGRDETFSTKKNILVSIQRAAAAE